MSHEEIQSLFNEYLSRELSAALRKSVEEHLLSCQHCRATLEGQRHYLQLMEETSAELQTSSEFEKNLVQMAKGTPQVTHWTVGKILSFAAAIVFAFGASFWAGNRLMEMGSGTQTGEVGVVRLPVPELPWFGKIQASTDADVFVLDGASIEQNSGSVSYEFESNRLARIETPAGKVDVSEMGSSLRVSIFESAEMLAKDPKLSEGKFALPEDSSPRSPFVVISMGRGSAQLIGLSSALTITSGEMAWMNPVLGVKQMEEEKRSAPITPNDSPSRTPVEENAAEGLAVIEGQVVDENGVGIPEASVYLFGIHSKGHGQESLSFQEFQERAIRRQVNAGEDGRYRIARLERGLYFLGSTPMKGRSLSLAGVLIIGPGFEKQRSGLRQNIPLAAGMLEQSALKLHELEEGSQTEISIPAQASGVAEGTIRNAEGEPIAGARIFAGPALPELHGRMARGIGIDAVFEMAEPFFAQARSNGNGNYRLDGVRGAVRIFVKAAGYFGEEVDLKIPAGEVENEDFTLEPILPLISARGLIVDSENKPVPGARVFLAESGDMFSFTTGMNRQRYFESKQRHQTQANIEGKFYFDSVAGFSASSWEKRERSDTSKGRFWIQAEGYLPAWSQEFSVLDAQKSEIKIQLHKSAPLRVRVVEEGSASPIAFAEVTFSILDRLGTEGDRDSSLMPPGVPGANKTDANGEILLEAAAGRLIVRANREGYKSESEPVTLHSKSDGAALLIKLKRLKWVIRGRLETTAEEPFFSKTEVMPIFDGFFATKVLATALDPRPFLKTKTSLDEIKMLCAGENARLDVESKFFVTLDPIHSTDEIFLLFSYGEEIKEVRKLSYSDVSKEVVFRIDPRLLQMNRASISYRAMDATKGAVLQRSSIFLSPSEITRQSPRFTDSEELLKDQGKHLHFVSPPGKYDLAILSPGMAAYVIPNIVLSPGEKLGLPDVLMYPESRARCVLRSEPFQPSSRTWRGHYSIANEAGIPILAGNVGSDAEFTVGQLSPGRYRFYYVSADFGFAGHAEGVIASGVENEISIPVHESIAVKLRFSEELRKELRLGLVRIYNSFGRFVTSVKMEIDTPSTDLTLLYSGSYRFELIGAGKVSRSGEFTLSPGSQNIVLIE